ncbi:hypothetical protein F8388_000279 [Cannabis sativa]|uniref:RING-type E3 ubiquitin transferase n=1 Tax=Cannabis sativa TaxID=3483 RepID=A0A7J6EYF5_CANSA|nr:hypothetical protein G4B88_028752 [Cannabis sativa]KAF4372063.1 hypothetical protein F8388_000279 [Cannabis sativa]
MYVRQCDEREASLKKDAEMKAMHDAEEIEKLEIALTCNLQQYQQFTWEEIQSATCNFSEVLIIGFGGYGTAFKCKFHQTTAAVKVLSSKSNESCKDKQFLREYTENGGLEDWLMQRQATPPIPWFDSPNKSSIHRDLKPANILLDQNLDQLEPNEYQRTGLISPKSDVYSLGIVILQLLTAKPALALAHVVETAVREGHLEDIFDSNAGNWPSKETKEMVELGLRCVELFRKDRLDLQA